MTNTDDKGVTLEVDPEVEKFLEGVELIKTEVGEMKSFKEKIEVKQDELGGKIDGLFEQFSKFVENFNKEPDKPEVVIPEAVKTLPERETLIEGKGVEMHKDDAVDAGLRAILIGSLDPDVKTIHLMSDLAGRNAYKPRPDPNARGYNLALAGGV